MNSIQSELRRNFPGLQQAAQRHQRAFRALKRAERRLRKAEEELRFRLKR